MTNIFRNTFEPGGASAGLRGTIARQGRARIIAATSASQYSFLREPTGWLVIDLRQVEMFHRDGDVGLPVTQGASFRRCLTGLPMVASEPARLPGVQPSVRVTVDWDATECRRSGRDGLNAR